MRIAILSAVFFASIATPAMAQDEATSSPFQGPYVGVLGGVDSASTEQDSALGVLYGGVVGYDFDLGGAVFGVEGEATGSTGKYCVADDEICVKAGRDLYAGVRLGLVDGDTLFYIKGGYTNAELRAEVTSGSTTVSVSDTGGGWRLGAGVETKVAANVSLRGEIRYSHYSIDLDQDFSASIERYQGLLGLNYRF